MAQQHLQNMTQRLSHLERMNETLNHNLNQIYDEKIKPLEDTMTGRINDTISTNITTMRNENVKIIDDRLKEIMTPIKAGISEMITENVLTNLNIIYKEKMTTFDDRITGKINQYLSRTSNFSHIGMTGTTGSHIDIKIDSDDSLTLTNSKSEDIDLFIPKLNLLSDLDSTAINNGSMVVYGGMSIMKHLYIGEGIYFKNSGNSPSNLDYYNEGTIRIQVMGIWKDILDIGVKFQCLGSSVTLMINETTDISTTTGIIQNTVDTYLPTNLCPQFDIGYGIYVIDNNAEMFGKITIYTTGKITINSLNNTNFTGTGPSGFKSLCVTYLVK